jgi:hypothetical protein
MQLCYNKINGYLGELPERVILSNGLTRTDPSSYTDEELEEWGYVVLQNMPTVNIDEYVSFNNETYEWEILKKPLEPQWDEVRKKRSELLAETDWYIIRFVERGTPIPDMITTYRKSLRDITLQENPFFIEWPVLEEV